MVIFHSYVKLPEGTHRIHGAGILMLTWLGYIDGINVSIYTSTMDPSWDSELENPPMFKNGKPSISMGHGFHSYVSLPMGIVNGNHLSMEVWMGRHNHIFIGQCRTEWRFEQENHWSKWDIFQHAMFLYHRVPRFFCYFWKHVYQLICR